MRIEKVQKLTDVRIEIGKTEVVVPRDFISLGGGLVIR